MRRFLFGAFAACILATAAYGQAGQGPAIIDYPTVAGNCLKTGAQGGGHVADSGGPCAAAGSGVTSFNTRTGAVTWQAGDAATAGITLPTPSNPSGSCCYVDANGALHFVSPWYDSTLWGAKFAGDATRPWMTSAFGSGITETSSGQQPNFVINRNDYFAGGSGLDFGLNETTNLGKGVNVKTTADAASGATSLTIQANANIAVGQSVFGPCVQTGETVASISGTALGITLGLACNIPSGTQLGFPNASNSTPANQTTGLQGTVASYTTSNTTASTGTSGYSFKFADSGAILEGANLLCHDYTGRKSSIAGGGCLGAEMDVVASGPDDALNRAINDDVFAESGPSADGATTIGWGIRLRPSGANAQNTPNPAEVLYGFSANTMATQPGGAQGQYGSFNHGHFCDGGELTGCFDIVSGTISPTTTAQTTSGPNLVFALGTNVNVGQIASGTNIPTGDTVSAVYQCAASQPLAGCSSATNETLVVLASNVSGTVANGATITFTGAMPDGSSFNGWFTDGFANWTDQSGTGHLKAGTTKNTGTVFDLQGFGEDSTNTTGIAYGDILFKEVTNTHGAVVGEIDVTPTGSGTVVVPSIDNVAITQPASLATLTIASGKTLTASNTLTLTATDGSTLAIGAGGTLGSNAYTSTAYAPLASPTFTGTVTLPDGTTCAAACTWGSAIAMGNHGITGVNGLITNNAAGAQVQSVATSATVPSLLPNRASTTTGWGANASGAIDGIIAGVDVLRLGTGSHAYAVAFAGASVNETGALCYNGASSPVNEILLDTVVGACNTSRRFLKTDIQSMVPEEALSETMLLQPVWYRWDQKTHPTWDTALHPGFIADDVEPIDKKLVTYTKGGELKGVAYDQMSAFNTAAIQALKYRLDNLSARLDALTEVHQ